MTKFWMARPKANGDEEAKATRRSTWAERGGGGAVRQNQKRTGRPMSWITRGPSGSARDNASVRQGSWRFGGTSSALPRFAWGVLPGAQLLRPDAGAGADGLNVWTLYPRRAPSCAQTL